MPTPLKFLVLVPFFALMIACSSSSSSPEREHDAGPDASEDAGVETISGECSVVDGGYVCEAGPVVQK